MEKSQESNSEKAFLKKQAALERRIGLPLFGTPFPRLAESSPNLETWIEVVELLDGKELEGEELAAVQAMYPGT